VEVVNEFYTCFVEIFMAHKAAMVHLAENELSLLLLNISGLVKDLSHLRPYPLRLNLQLQH
jgi:hypothetical protein